MSAEFVYRDEAPRGFRPELIFNGPLLAAVVSTFHVHELVRQGAAPLVLLEPTVQPDDPQPVGSPWGAIRHANERDVNVCQPPKRPPWIEHLLDTRGRHRHWRVVLG